MDEKSQHIISCADVIQDKILKYLAKQQLKKSEIDEVSSIITKYYSTQIQTAPLQHNHIALTKLHFKNLFNYDNTTLDFTKMIKKQGVPYAIIAPNGHGKSALIDIIAFAFTGCYFRSESSIHPGNPLKVGTDQYECIVEFTVDVYSNSNSTSTSTSTPKKTTKYRITRSGKKAAGKIAKLMLIDEVTDGEVGGDAGDDTASDTTTYTSIIKTSSNAKFKTELGLILPNIEHQIQSCIIPQFASGFTDMSPKDRKQIIETAMSLCDYQPLYAEYAKKKAKATKIITLHRNTIQSHLKSLNLDPVEFARQQQQKDNTAEEETKSKKPKKPKKIAIEFIDIASEELIIKHRQESDAALQQLSDTSDTIAEDIEQLHEQLLEETKCDTDNDEDDDDDAESEAQSQQELMDTYNQLDTKVCNLHDSVIDLGTKSQTLYAEFKDVQRELLRQAEVKDKESDNINQDDDQDDDGEHIQTPQTHIDIISNIKEKLSDFYAEVLYPMNALYKQSTGLCKISNLLLDDKNRDNAQIQKQEKEKLSICIQTIQQAITNAHDSILSSEKLTEIQHIKSKYKHEASSTEQELVDAYHELILLQHNLSDTKLTNAEYNQKVDEVEKEEAGLSRLYETLGEYRGKLLELIKPEPELDLNVAYTKIQKLLKKLGVKSAASPPINRPAYIDLLNDYTKYVYDTPKPSHTPEEAERELASASLTIPAAMKFSSKCNRCTSNATIYNRLLDETSMITEEEKTNLTDIIAKSKLINQIDALASSIDEQFTNNTKAKLYEIHIKDTTDKIEKSKKMIEDLHCELTNNDKLLETNKLIINTKKDIQVKRLITAITKYESTIKSSTKITHSFIKSISNTLEQTQKLKLTIDQLHDISARINAKKSSNPPPTATDNKVLIKEIMQKISKKKTKHQQLNNQIAKYKEQQSIIHHTAKLILDANTELKSTQTTLIIYQTITKLFNKNPDIYQITIGEVTSRLSSTLNRLLTMCSNPPIQLTLSYSANGIDVSATPTQRGARRPALKDVKQKAAVKDSESEDGDDDSDESSSKSGSDNDDSADESSDKSDIVTKSDKSDNDKDGTINFSNLTLSTDFACGYERTLINIVFAIAINELSSQTPPTNFFIIDDQLTHCDKASVAKLTPFINYIASKYPITLITSHTDMFGIIVCDWFMTAS
jgi:DNA repair exonuclease SbcCD ATPase subunit